MPDVQPQESFEQQADRANLQIDDKVRKSVARHVDLEKRVKNINAEKRGEREQMENLGIHPRAYQDEIRNFKTYDEAERAAYMMSRRRMQQVLAPVEGQLFAEEMAERAAKAAKKAEKEGNKPRTDDELNARTDTDPRSDPDAGGAGTETPPTTADVDQQIKDTSARRDAEQEDGAQVLNNGLGKTKAAGRKKKSQSEIAADKLSSAGLN